MAIKRLDGVNRTIATCFVRRVSHSFRHGFCNIVCKAAIATPVKVFLESNFEGDFQIARAHTNNEADRKRAKASI